MSGTVTPDILKLTAKIVSAHIGRNIVPTDALPALIRSVFQTLSTAGEAQLELETKAPAVPITKSVFPDYIVCLEDGKRLKMLKRHLRNSFGMTPSQYREKWGLPREYPMVAPSYAKQRSAMAKNRGLGRRSGTGAALVSNQAEPTMPLARGRKPRGSTV